MRNQMLHRFFFAILPPAPLAGDIGRSSHWFGDGRLVLPQHLHITLGLSPDYPAVPDDVVAMMQQAGSAVIAAPFGIVLDEAAGSAASIALRPSEPLAELLDVQARLARAMARLGLPLRRQWRFNPHMTLLYRKGEAFRRQIGPISWRVEEFVLVHSHLGQTRHQIIARWPLSKPRATAEDKA